MSGRVLRFDDSAHRDADALLPWFINGTLEGHDLAAVERHVRDCARCRREVELLRQVQAFCAIDRPVPDAAPSYRRLAAKLDRRAWGRAVVDHVRRLFRPWVRAPGWARWAIAAQFSAMLGIVALFAIHGGGSPAPYQTLGAAAARAAPAGTIAVVFAPELTEAELRRIVQAAGARLVDGPTESNAYVLQVSDGRQEDALAALRSEAGVVLAEPLTARPDR